jgi:hypothetical protein
MSWGKELLKMKRVWERFKKYVLTNLKILNKHSIKYHSIWLTVGSCEEWIISDIFCSIYMTDIKDELNFLDIYESYLK